MNKHNFLSTHRLVAKKKSCESGNKLTTNNKILGMGASCIVYEGEFRGQKVAVKVIKKSNKNIRCDEVREEIKIHKNLNHPNVIKLIEAIETDEEFIMVLPIVKTDLLDYVITKDRIDHKKIIIQIVEGLKYIHSLGICHRDIKPENILVGENDHVFICDFGFACHDTGKLTRKCGSYPLVSPQILNSKNDQGYCGISSDIWSLGMLIHFMFVGEYPMEDENKKNGFRKIMKGEIELNENLTLVQFALLKNLILFKSNERLSLDQVLSHTFFRTEEKQASCVFDYGFSSMLDGFSTLSIGSEMSFVFCESSRVLGDVY